jgi:hypothetical protein
MMVIGFKINLDAPPSFLMDSTTRPKVNSGKIRN